MLKFDEFTENLKRKINVQNDKILFLCIGTSENTADSIGPLIGSYLKQNIGSNMVLGDMKNNIKNKYDLIYNYPKIKNKFVIAIDAAISPECLNGKIFVSNNPIVMGLALNKNKGVVGDVSIKVGISNFEINNKNYINNLAKFISKGIIKAINVTD